MQIGDRITYSLFKSKVNQETDLEKTLLRRHVMKLMQARKLGGKVIIMGLVLLMQTSVVYAAEEIVGDWQVKMDFDGREMMASMSFSKDKDGNLTGKWGSSELSKIKFEDGKLSFVRTMGFGDRQFTSDFTGTLKDGKITGMMSNDFADMQVIATRKKPICPAVGIWDFNFSVGDFDIEGKLTISQTKEGALEGKWTENMGEHKVSNIKFEDGKLTLTRKSKIEDMEFESTFTGTIKDNELTGTLSSDMGDIPIKAKRFGAALIGNWELTSESERGPRTSVLMVDPDLTARYETFGGEVPAKNFKLEGDQVTFKIEMGFGDRTFQMEFKGKLDGKALNGLMISDRGENEVTGKKIEKKVEEKKAESTTM